MPDREAYRHRGAAVPSLELLVFVLYQRAAEHAGSRGTDNVGRRSYSSVPTMERAMLAGRFPEIVEQRVECGIGGCTSAVL
jgi:hypothetical protein